MREDIKTTNDQVIKAHVPTKHTAARHTHPWIDTKLRRATRRNNNAAFRKAKQTKNAIDWDRYKIIKAQTHKDLRTAYRKYMGDVISKDAQEQTKSFWSYIKSKKQESSGVAPLKNKDGFFTQ